MRPAVGWIGLGRIGWPMAERVLGAGWPLRVWSRRPQTRTAALALGAAAVATPEALARECEIVVTIVGDSTDVCELHERMLPQARPGAVYLEMTTAAPATALRSAELAARSGAVVLDAPVSGGVAGARQGALTQFVGGAHEALARCTPLLQAFSRDIVHCGSAGAGYRMKLVNQTIVAGILLGLADGAQLARGAGFDAELLRRALGRGTASGLLFDSYAERMRDAGGAVTFTLGLLRKDLRLARDEALARGAGTRLLDFALVSVAQACEQHGESAGVQALALGGAEGRGSPGGSAA